MRFSSIGSQFTLHAPFPHSVTLMQLRFTSLAVTSSWQDFHPQACAHAGRTTDQIAASVIYSYSLDVTLDTRTEEQPSKLVELNCIYFDIAIHHAGAF